MIRKLTALAAVTLLALGLVGCGHIGLRTDGVHFVDHPNLLFVNGSEVSIGSVGVSTERESEMAGNASRAPLEYGETRGFGVGHWPVVLAVFRDLEARREIVRLTIPGPPPEGDCWVVTAVDGADGLSLELSNGAVHSGPAWNMSDTPDRR